MMDSLRLNQSLVECSTDCIKILDLEARLLFMNGLGCKALEIDDFSQVANAYWLDFWNGPYADAARAAIETAKTGGSGHFQGYCPTWKGTPKWWDVVITPLLDTHGKPEQLLAVSRDITELKLIEERLQANACQLRDTQRLAKIGSWSREVGSERIQWSDENFRIFGVPNDTQLNFQTFLSLVHPKDQTKILEVEQRAISSLEPHNVEFRIIRPDGEVRFLHAIAEAIKNDRGVPVRLVGAAQDVTERMKDEQLLRESERHLKNAEQLANIGHWVWDLHSNQVICSEGMLRIFGQTQDYKPSYEDLLLLATPEEDRERINQVVRDSIAKNRGFVIEFQIARPDGGLRTVRSISEISMDEEGRALQVFGTVQDITDEKRAQRESLARHKLESLGTMAGGIAHDFNNLLTAALSRAELGLVDLDAGLSPEEELKGIRDLAKHGSEIVRQLMIYAGKESAAVELSDLSTIVKQTLELIKISVSKHAVIEAVLSENLPAVRANAAQVQQIIMNLVINASDAIGDRDGVIRVTTSCVNVNSNWLGWAENHFAASNYIQLEVSDTGHGMPPETQAKVFDPFFTTKSTGHGLGLSTVQGIVRSLGGRINCTSEPHKGTTFQILLPCIETEAGSATESISAVETVR
jgi:PAS domain S-box-containing protein